MAFTIPKKSVKRGKVLLACDHEVNPWTRNQDLPDFYFCWVCKKYRRTKAESIRKGLDLDGNKLPANGS